MFPFTSFRAECLKSLGFDGFFQDALSDTEELYAFLLPRAVFEAREYEALVTFLQAAFAQHGWSANTEVLEMGIYETNHYRMRCHTHILGPHILLHLTPAATVATKPAKPDIAPWTVVEVYDKSYIWMYEAAFPADHEITLNRLKDRVRSHLDLIPV